jgi:hypothetical protein
MNNLLNEQDPLYGGGFCLPGSKLFPRRDRLENNRLETGKEACLDLFYKVFLRAAVCYILKRF